MCVCVVGEKGPQEPQPPSPGTTTTAMQVPTGILKNKQTNNKRKRKKNGSEKLTFLGGKMAIADLGVRER